MRIVVPHTSLLHPATRAWAHQHGAWLIDVSGSDTAYHDLLEEFWAVPEDLWIVEHDMLPPPAAPLRMRRCPRPWCVNPYTIGAPTLITRGLGSTRFTSELLTTHPDLIRDLREQSDPGIPARHWTRLDLRLSTALLARGLHPHPHARAQHLHRYPKGA